MKSFHVVRELLDRQLVDTNDVPCGKIDDVEFETETDTRLHIRALLLGNGAASVRLPKLFALLSQKLFGRRIIRIAWTEVAAAGDRITLKRTAAELGLSEEKTAAGKFMRNLSPG
jgi:sporulation protein YlmC with PRC-barrel domain